MAASIEGKVVLVTGVSSGLGRAVAMEFAARGARVLGVARRAELGRELEREIRDTGGAFAFLEADVSQVDDCGRAIAAAVECHDGLDVLVNNAAFEGEPPVVDSHAATEAWWDAIVDTNLKGAFFCCRYALAPMLQQGGGVILNVASINAVNAVAAMAAYNSSKAGLVQLTRTLAVEYAGRGIRVNAILLGGVDTPQAARTQAALARHVRGPDFERQTKPASSLFYDPKEIAATLALLCHDDARTITGATIAIDRGVTAGLLASTAIFLTTAEVWAMPEKERTP